MSEQETHEMVLHLDELDHETIQQELAERRARGIAMGGMESQIPDGDSNEEGALLAECIRDLNEYRAMYDAANPKD